MINKGSASFDMPALLMFLSERLTNVAARAAVHNCYVGFSDVGFDPLFGAGQAAWA